MIGHLVIILSVGGVLTNQPSGTSFDSAFDGLQLIHRGHIAAPSVVPWHAGIYLPTPQGFVLQCGGTLISPTIVVTAAHCFWNHKTNREFPDLNTYHVTLGKTSRVYDIDIPSPHVQVLEVKRVVLFPRFEGVVARNLEYDLAIVETRTPAIITDSVRPASVVLNHGNPATGSVGVVAGWGFTEDGILSDALRSITLPYVDHDTCYASLGGNRYKRLFTSDKFCAGYNNVGKSVCPGDSGGGFVVMEGEGASRRPVVRGVVSLDFRPQSNTQSATGCYALHYTGFTNLGELRFVEWLSDFLPSVPCPAVTTTPAVKDVFCDKDRAEVDCSMPMLPGSVAVSRCAVGYRAGDSTSKTATCRRDGSWSNAGVNCQLFQLPGADYITLPGLHNYYKSHVTLLSWSAAKTACESEGSHLVILNSQAEYEAVLKLFTDNRHKSVWSRYFFFSWVGVKESDTSQGAFFTVLGQSLSSTGYSTWARKQPDDTRTLGDFVVINTGAVGLYDFPASSDAGLAFICEREV